MRLLFLLALLLAPQILHAEESFTLTYTGTQKWLSESEKQPLLNLRTAAEAKKIQPLSITVRTPAKNPELQLERLNIITEIISRKTNGVLMKISDTPSSDNQFIFTLK